MWPRFLQPLFLVGTLRGPIPSLHEPLPLPSVRLWGATSAAAAITATPSQLLGDCVWTSCACRLAFRELLDPRFPLSPLRCDGAFGAAVCAPKGSGEVKDDSVFCVPLNRRCPTCGQSPLGRVGHPPGGSCGRYFLRSSCCPSRLEKISSEALTLAWRKASPLSFYHCLTLKGTDHGLDKAGVESRSR